MYEKQVNTFELEAINLGKLKKMVIGHDASGKGKLNILINAKV